MSARYQIKVLKPFCKGCGLCVSICPRKTLVFSQNVNKNGFHFPESDHKPRGTPGKLCSGCRQCAIICPEAAIEIRVISAKGKRPAAASCAVATLATETESRGALRNPAKPRTPFLPVASHRAFWRRRAKKHK